MAPPRLASLALCLGLLSVASAELVIRDAQVDVVALGYVLLTATNYTIEYERKGHQESVFVHCEPAPLEPEFAWQEATRYDAFGLAPDGSPTKLTPTAVPASVTPPADVHCSAYSLDPPLVGGGPPAAIGVLSSRFGEASPSPGGARQGEPHVARVRALAAPVSPYRVLHADASIGVGPGRVLEARPVAAAGRGEAGAEGAAAMASPGDAPTARILSNGSLKISLAEPARGSAPFTLSAVDAWVELATPLVVASKVRRELTVSGDGSVRVEERYQVEHRGPKLKGPWSRLELQTVRGKDAGSKGSFLARGIPESARDITFRDPIGNISSSTVARVRGELAVNLQPRYPLFGGWKAEFAFAYSVPPGAFVGRALERGRHQTAGGSDIPDSLVGSRGLVARLGPSVAELPVEDLEVRVVLPRGARLVAADSKTPVLKGLDVFYGVLDLFGPREVAVLRRLGYAPHLDAPITVAFRQARFGANAKGALAVALLAVLAFPVLRGKRAAGGA